MFSSLVIRIITISGQELILEWEARFTNSYSVVLLLVCDWMSIFFMSVVSLISMRVLFYRTSYMSRDPFYGRFLRLLIIFIIRIWILILRPNFIRILLGWDGLGVTSYLLVLYYQRAKSFNAGIITALTNRIGDVGLLVVIGILTRMGRWSFIYYRRYNQFLRVEILILLRIVAITKSAQLPFSAWLPAAIAAPTPVSSLVHSSTLVTAGVYLLIRINYLIRNCGFLWILILLGTVTMFMAGRSAIKELDIKKVVALSTLRQLGIIFIVLGMGLPLLAFFHLISHAYFKAMLFMRRGCIIHSINDYQDMRVIGGGLKQIPLSLSIIMVANLRLCGLPFISGFFSKDLILELIIMRSINRIIFILAGLSTRLTVLYSVRMVKLIFFKEPKEFSINNIAEMGKIEFTRVFILLLPSIFGGILILWIVGSHNILVFLPLWIKLRIIIVIILSRFIGILENKKIKFKRHNHFVHFIWFLPFIFSNIGRQLVLFRGKNLIKHGDSSWNSLIRVDWLSWLNLNSANYINNSLKSSFIKRVGILILTLLLV